MNPTALEFDLRTRAEVIADEATGVLLGAGFTFALIWGMAHIERGGHSDAGGEVQDLRAYALPFEPPPPLPQVQAPTDAPELAVPLSGIELGAADSPVSIGVVPADLEFMLPAVSRAPKASVPFSLPHTDLKPRALADLAPGHIYQESEVDQKPRALVRAVPPLPGEVIGDASVLRVVLILLIDARGRVETVRVAESSGSARFDEIVAQTVKDEWLFSPAVRRGKKVRVMAEQGFRVSISGGGSPFSLN